MTDIVMFAAFVFMRSAAWNLGRPKVVLLARIDRPFSMSQCLTSAGPGRRWSVQAKRPMRHA